MKRPKRATLSILLCVLAVAFSHGRLTAQDSGGEGTPGPSPEAAWELAFAGVESNADWTPISGEFNGVEMVLVPAGCFLMGSDSGNLEERPAQEFCFDEPFWIDRYEVTNAQFAALGGVASGRSHFVGDALPRESIDWFEARDFCALRGARLPREAEWEYAARGPDGLSYPWGNSFIASNVARVSDLGGEVTDVGSRPGGASWVGAEDLIGNAWEWVSTIYRDYPYVASDGREDLTDTSSARVLRGGTFHFDFSDYRAASRHEQSPSFSFFFIGFRCARPATPEIGIPTPAAPTEVPTATPAQVIIQTTPLPALWPTLTPATVLAWDAEEVTVLQGHTNAIQSVAFSPDGSILASGSSDRTVRLWDTRTGAELMTLQGPGIIASIAFSPDGVILAAGTWSDTVHLWDIRTGEELAILTEHDGWVRGIDFSPDGLLLASASADGTIQLWNLSEGLPRDAQPLILRGHTDQVTAVTFSPDGALLASTSWDTTLRLWDPYTGQEQAARENHERDVYTLAFSPDGTLLASGGRDRTIRVQEVQTGEEILAIPTSDNIFGVAFSPDGATLAVSLGYPNGNTVRLWDVATGTEIAALEGHSDFVNSIAFSPDGSMLASGSADRTVRLWRFPVGASTP